MKRSYIKGKERKTGNNVYVPLQLKAGELLIDVLLIGGNRVLLIKCQICSYIVKWQLNQILLGAFDKDSFHEAKIYSAL